MWGREITIISIKFLTETLIEMHEFVKFSEKTRVVIHKDSVTSVDFHSGEVQRNDQR